MKASKIFIAVMSCAVFVQVATAQSSVPAISDAYSNDTIAEMIRKYRSSHSHDATPPAKTAVKFRADFPKASDVEWEVADSIYEVEFDVKFRDWKAYYDAEGNLLMTIEEIYRSELPAVVKNAAEAKYPKYHFEDIDKIRRGTEVFYKIEMELRDTEIELLIQADGRIIDEKTDY
ncbi:MAG: PepSY-like domain-containing protein [Prevotellaceae bacterium]|jgi:hypothetical protein|nr:PepSY-like domain-containing protein [Prevotellaceae bacterium]